MIFTMDDLLEAFRSDRSSRWIFEGARHMMEFIGEDSLCWVKTCCESVEERLYQARSLKVDAYRPTPYFRCRRKWILNSISRSSLSNALHCLPLRLGYFPNLGRWRVGGMPRSLIFGHSFGCNDIVQSWCRKDASALDSRNVYHSGPICGGLSISYIWEATFRVASYNIHALFIITVLSDHVCIDGTHY